MKATSWLRISAIALLAALVSAKPIQAQELEPIPTFAPGGNAVLLPVQSVRPLPTGAYPGGAGSHTKARQKITAEFSFAFDEAEEGEGIWKLPSDVIRVMDRNPTLHVDPEHLAYQGLLSKPKDLKRYQIYEPLHGQLRAISAMFDTRHLVLPLQVKYEPVDDADEVGASQSDEGAAEAEAEASGTVSTTSEPMGRAVLLMVLIDIRRSAVLWHGEVKGDPAPVDSSALFASLAARVAEWLILF
jgi:hypothetical protein